jgi:hypothetical protein
MLGYQTFTLKIVRELKMSITKLMRRHFKTLKFGGMEEKKYVSYIYSLLRVSLLVITSWRKNF